MRLETTEKVKNRKLGIAIDVLLALMLGGACFYVFITMFGMKWPGSGMFSGSVSGGLAGVWDKIADRLGSLDYVILPKYKADVTKSGALKYGTALTMILCAFSIISYFIIKARTRLLMLLFAVPLIIAMLCYGLTPSVYAGAFLAAAVIIVLAVMRVDGELDPKFFVLPLAMLIVTGCVLVGVDKTVSLREPEELASAADSFKQAVDKIRYGTDPLPAGDIGSISGKDLKASRGDIESVKETLGSSGGNYSGTDTYSLDTGTGPYAGSGLDTGNASDVSSSEDDEADDKSDNNAGSETALKVTMSTPDSYYLRGFIGASYEKNKWNTLTNDTFYDMRDTVFWLNRRDFDGLSQMSRAAELGDSPGYGITYDAPPDGTEAETPDALPDDEEDDETPDEDDTDDEEDDEEEEDDDTAAPGTTFGGNNDEDDEEDFSEGGDDISTVGFIDAVYAEGEEDADAVNKISIKVKGASRRTAFTPYEMELDPEKGDKPRKSEMKLPKGTVNYGGSHLGTEGIGGKSSYSYKASGNITGVWTDAVGKLYTAPQSEDVQSYFVSESHYNVMQYENYLDIPDKLKQLISREIGPSGDISEDHAEYKETIDKISNYLTSYYIYSENFSKPKRKEDIVEKFVESRSGCDMHYATLATLMFRYFGIPARYVEGYIVTPHMVEGKAGGDEIDVTKQSSHAWTEIYIDGFGWVPFEATPEYQGIMKEADMTIGLQNVDYENTPPEPEEEDEEDFSENEEEDSEQLGKKLLKMLLTLIIILIICILLYIAYKFGNVILEERRWKKAFQDKDPAKAIRALYQYALMKRWKLSKVAEGLGLRASYSREKMTEGERRVMLAEFEKAREQYQKDRALEKERNRREKARAKEQAKKEKAELKAEKKQEKAEAKTEKKLE